MKRFFLSLSPCLLVPLSLLIGCTSAPPDTSKSQIQQLQQQLKADEATLQQLQQQEQADQALIKQIQQELSELRKRRNVPCPHWVAPDADRSIGSSSDKGQVTSDEPNTLVTRHSPLVTSSTVGEGLPYACPSSATGIMLCVLVRTVIATIPAALRPCR